MDILKYSVLCIIRKPIQNLILCIILILIFLGELIGLCVYSISKKGEEDAFIYHGSNLIIDGENLNLTPTIYNQITSIEHIIGVNNWREIVATPVGMNNVKEHTGVEPGIATENVSWSSNSVVLLALMNTELYSWFRWEKSVSLISGNYPNSENKGVLIESRFAEQNNLSIGDDITYTIEESGNKCTYKVCGIFKVDSDFEITEDNVYGEGVYIYSPYNVVFMDYEYAAETIGFESTISKGCSVYVDKYDSIEFVKSKLRDLLGEDVEIYNTTDGYLDNESGIVVLMKNYSFTILVYVSLIGSIIILLVLTYYANQYQYESGIYVALGSKKGRVIIQYFLSMLCILVISILVSSLIFHLFGEKVIYLLNQKATNINLQNNKQLVIIPYKTPNLNQSFKIDLDMNRINSIQNYIIVFFMSVTYLIISLIIPIYNIIVTKPQFLLKKQ